MRGEVLEQLTSFVVGGLQARRLRSDAGKKGESGGLARDGRLSEFGVVEGCGTDAQQVRAHEYESARGISVDDGLDDFLVFFTGSRFATEGAMANR